MTKARDIASASPAPSTVSATEIGYLDGVTSAIQTQIDSKIGSASAISPTLIDAKGDLIVGSAADTAARLAVGTDTYVLTADSSATNGVKWAAPAGGGKVLQVVSATYSTEKTNTTTTYSDTDLTLSITPSASNSKVLVMVSQLIYCERSSDNAGVGIRLLRGATTIMTQSADYSTWMNITSGSNAQSGGVSSIIYLDSPATTSSTTYKTQFKAHFGNNTTAKCQPSGGTSTITLLEIGA